MTHQAWRRLTAWTLCVAFGVVGVAALGLAALVGYALVYFAQQPDPPPVCVELRPL